MQTHSHSYLIDMHLIQSLKNEFCFDLPMFSKYLASSINSYFYKMTLFGCKTSICYYSVQIQWKTFFPRIYDGICFLYHVSIRNTKCVN